MKKYDCETLNKLPNASRLWFLFSTLVRVLAVLSSRWYIAESGDLHLHRQIHMVPAAAWSKNAHSIF